MIDFRDYVPQAPDGERWRFRQNGRVRGTVELLYKTRDEGGALLVELEHDGGNRPLALFDRMAITSRGLELRRIQLPEDPFDVSPPFVFTPDPRTTDTNERLLPDGYWYRGTDPISGHGTRKKARQVTPRGSDTRIDVLDLGVEAIARDGARVLDVSRLRFQKGLGLTEVTTRLVEPWYHYVREPGSGLPPVPAELPVEDVLPFLGATGSSARRFQRRGSPATKTGLAIRQDGDRFHWESAAIDLVPRAFRVSGSAGARRTIGLAAASAWGAPLPTPHGDMRLVDEALDWSDPAAAPYRIDEPQRQWRDGRPIARLVVEAVWSEDGDTAPWATGAGGPYADLPVVYLHFRIQALAADGLLGTLEQVLALNEDFGPVCIASREDQNAATAWDVAELPR